MAVNTYLAPWQDIVDLITDKHAAHVELERVLGALLIVLVVEVVGCVLGDEQHALELNVALSLEMAPSQSLAVVLHQHEETFSLSGRVLLEFGVP